MTEAGNCLVRVRAQVMSRDEATEGWLILNGGGLANVSVRRRRIRRGANHNNDDISDSEGECDTHKNPTKHSATDANGVPCSHCLANGEHVLCPLPDGPASADAATSSTDDRDRCTKNHIEEPKYEYLICGKRITDQTVILSCTIKEDFEYNKVMPTFHHWRTGDERFGLTFQTAADARVFDKGVRAAVEELLERWPTNRPAQDPALGDNDDNEAIFEAVNLPARPADQRAQPYVQNVTDYETKVQLLPKPHVKLLSRSVDGYLPPSQPSPAPHEPAVNIASDNNAYVQLSMLQQHGYRNMQHVVKEQPRCDKNNKFITDMDKCHSTDFIKKQPELLDYEKPINPPTDSSADTETMKIWKLVSPDDNREHSPSIAMRCIECISFVPCARSMVARRRDIPQRTTFKRETYSYASEDKVVDHDVRNQEHIRSIVRSVMSWIPCLHCYKPLASTHKVCSNVLCCKSNDV